MKLQNEKWLRVFFSEPDDNGGGGDEPLIDDVDLSGDDVNNDPVPPPPPAPVVDAAALAKEFGAQIAAVLPRQEPAKAPELTPEEARKLLKVMEVDDDLLAGISAVEPAKQRAAIEKLRDGIFTQAFTAAQIAIREQQKESQTQFESQYGEALSALRTQQVEKVYESFGKEYPQLAKRELRPLVDAVSTQIAKSGKSFSDQKSAWAAVAAGVTEVIKASNPEFKLTTNNGSAGGGIPVTTPGAGGGGGSVTAGNAKSKFRAASLLAS